MNMKALLPYIGFLFLTLLVLTLCYSVAFCWWMTAHPVYQSPEWQTLFYKRLSLLVPLAACWLIGLRALVKRRVGQSARV